jgi:hypothetical protein
MGIRHILVANISKTVADRDLKLCFSESLLNLLSVCVVVLSVFGQKQLCWV